VRVLIDECLDWRLGRELAGHDTVSVQKMGWSGLQNGRLLELAQAQFDVFLTSDRNLSYQQNLSRYQIAVVVLEAEGTQLRQTLPLMPKVLEVLGTLRVGEVIVLGP
jgi:hypothetical protein